MVIEDFIIGKYYRYISYLEDVYYFKLKQVEGNKLYVDGWTIWCNIYLENNTHILFNTTQIFVEVSLCDFVKKLPYNNPIKINYIRKERIKKLLD